MDASHPGELGERLVALGRALGEREQAHADALAAARQLAANLHARVAAALDGFHRAVRESGAPHLRVALSEPRVDDKHLHSVQFDLRRGRHAAIVTVKSRGDVTLVGPFRDGKAEGPCKSFPFADPERVGEDLEAALAGFLEAFLEAAAAP